MQTLPSNIEPEFYAYLKDLTCKDIIISAIEEGSVVFPRYDEFKVFHLLINIFFDISNSDNY